MEQSRWSLDTDEMEMASCLPSRPSTPQTVKALLRSPGSPLRTLGKKLSLTGLSVRSRRTSPDRGDSTRLKKDHVGVSSGPVPPLYNRRRGGSFRPLSIVTGTPFEFDVNRAMEIVQNHSDSSSPTRDPVKQTNHLDTMKPLREDDEKTIKPARSFIMAPPNLSPQGDASARESANNGQAQKHKEQKVVVADFPRLRRIPAPDISQHPVLQPDPYSSTSDAPLLFTTSRKEEIKRMVKEARRRFDEKEREAERQEAEGEKAEDEARVRNKIEPNTLPKPGNAFARDNYNNGGNQENPFAVKAISTGHTTSPNTSPNPPEAFACRPIRPRQISDTANTNNVGNNQAAFQISAENVHTDIFNVFSEGSPVAGTPTTCKTSADSGKSTTTPLSEGLEQKRTGLRKVTDLFKTKSEKPQSDFASPKGSTDMLHRPDLERYLRTTTNNHSYDYDEGQPYPRHPYTSRAWHSRNLKCTTCLDHCCAVCGRACCAYKAAALAVKIHKDNPESLKTAEERLLQIAFLFPYGQEAPTFLQCTKGGSIGCGKMVCPDCCGECPNPICKDIQCRKCKKNPWAECLWHDEDMNRRAL
ncbi:uncharacterized protein A1O5_04814 [Cladophialophora psammophila CBS 110553]|uniref:Uncharacterized protein n=1 Tax=Cladophialophora psammophila CBS 110553 TaxID=1182543 RepID=W9X4R1_9EURO|nr:uncharacterized protein A1O5_04814 [Cladophialophora psammophila CBS 110553]EXJ72310.1 hypothetical protein A1O5_04814 [Cladophialophora psammophila CBS 110553]